MRKIIPLTTFLLLSQFAYAGGNLMTVLVENRSDHTLCLSYDRYPESWNEGFSAPQKIAPGGKADLRTTSSSVDYIAMELIYSLENSITGECSKTNYCQVVLKRSILGSGVVATPYGNMLCGSTKVATDDNYFVKIDSMAR